MKTDIRCSMIRFHIDFEALNKFLTELRDCLELQNDNSILNIRKLVNNIVAVLKYDETDLVTKKLLSIHGITFHQALSEAENS